MLLLSVIFVYLPILAVTHHPKFTELMAGLELSDYRVHIRDFDVSCITPRDQEAHGPSLMKNRKQLRNQFDEFIFDLRRSSKKEIKIPVEIYQ